MPPLFGVAIDSYVYIHKIGPTPLLAARHGADIDKGFRASSLRWYIFGARAPKTGALARTRSVVAYNCGLFIDCVGSCPIIYRRQTFRRIGSRIWRPFAEMRLKRYSARSSMHRARR